MKKAMEREKKCPFRKDKDGEYLECYGSECMAYYEYEVPKYDYENTCFCNARSYFQRMLGCRVMNLSHYPLYNNGGHL